MKLTLSTALTLAVASPALAHADGSFHSHGAEVFLFIAAIGVAAAIAYKSMR